MGGGGGGQGMALINQRDMVVGVVVLLMICHVRNFQDRKTGTESSKHYVTDLTLVLVGILNLRG